LEDGGVALPDTKVEEIVPKLRAGKKRKREEREDDLEARYLRKIAREEAKEQDKADAEDAAKTEANGAQETETEADAEADVDATDAAEEVVANEKDDDSSSDESSDDEPPPQHESLSKSNENSEVEKASRTVFLGNVSTEAITSKSAKKTLLRHLASFFPSVTKQDPPFKVESIRFRSTAYAVKVPKKTAFIRKELMDETTKSTNAYAVYNSKVAAREAVKHLNGTIVLDRHLRVDQVAHPAKTEHKRCVFVGNLGFVDDDSQIREEANSRKENVKQRTQAPGDVEEGLWRQFSKAGIVESVRVVRDPQTRIGKGIAYVQFKVSPPSISPVTQSILLPETKRRRNKIC
jgi:nucleolar protein 12